MSTVLAASSPAPIAIPMAEMLFASSIAELKRFRDKVPEADRLELLTTWEALKRIHQLVQGGMKKTRAAKLVSAQMSTGDDGLSWQSLDKKYGVWLAAKGAWDVLVKAYHNGKGERLVKPETATYINQIVALSPRVDDCKEAAWREFQRRWFAGESIPGIGTRAELWAQRHPDWPLPSAMDKNRAEQLPFCFSTFNRAITKNKAVRTIAGKGFHAAHSEIHHLLRDRSELRPLELVVMDDVRLDWMVMAHHEGKWQVCYLWGIFALDVATGCVVGWTLKPSVKDEDTGKRQAIGRLETRKVLISILANHGLPQGYPMRLLLENASSTLTEEDKGAFLAMLSGRLEIEHTGLEKRALLKSGFREEGGMPWHKGWIEVWFRLLQTSTSLFQGTTGNRYGNDPATLKGAIKYTEATIKNAEAQGKMDKVDFYFDRWEDAVQSLSDLVNLLNHRHEHNLQGFPKVREWQDQDGQWHPTAHLAALLPAERMQVKIVSRSIMPAEMWAIKIVNQEFMAFEAAFLASLLADKETKTVRRNEIRITRPELADSLIYRMPDDSYEGEELRVAMLEGYTAHISRLNGESVASLNPVNRINPVNREAMKRAVSETYQANLPATKKAAEMLAPRQAALADLRAHNLAVLGEDRPVHKSIPKQSQASEQIEAARAEAKQRAEAPVKSRPRAVPAGVDDDLAAACG